MKSFSQRAGLKPAPQVAQIGAMSDELRASLSALKAGFTSLYGYTNDDDGIRHAMLEEPNIDQSDAMYFLFSCTSFINYLKANIAR